MTAIDDAFVARAQANPVTIELDGQAYTLRGTRAARSGPFGPRADLEVVDGSGAVLGYIMPYGSSERGAVKERFIDVGAPALFRTVEDAVREIVR